MPELPEVETVRRGLEPHLAGARLVRVDQRRPDLRFPFPPRFAERLTGARIERLDRRAKYLLAGLDTGDTLVTQSALPVTVVDTTGAGDVFRGAFAYATVQGWPLDRALPPDLSRLHATGTEVLDREGRTLSVLPAPGGVWRLATTTAEVPPHLLALLIAAEDRRFYAHPGVDPLALARAAWQWVRAGRVVSGGSTLTMQAARLLEPRPRTLRGKAIEILRALQLEARFSKEEILGIWLTLVRVMVPRYLSS